MISKLFFIVVSLSLLFPSVTPFFSGVSVYPYAISLLLLSPFFFLKDKKRGAYIYMLSLLFSSGVFYIVSRDFSYSIQVMTVFVSAYVLKTLIDDVEFMNSFSLVFFILFVFTILQISSPSLGSNFLNANAIGRFLFGKYYKETYLNFDHVYFIARAIGGSREGGFFNSLMIPLIFLFAYSKRYLCCVLAVVLFFLSISKMSIALPICIIIYFLRKKIDMIPYWVVIFASVLAIFIITTSDSAQKLMSESESIFHRFWGYNAIINESPGSFLYGISDGHYLYNDFFNKYFDYNKLYTGVSEVIAYGGLLGSVCVFFTLKNIGLRSSGVIYLLVSTFNVGLMTLDSYVIINVIVAVLVFSNKDEKQVSELRLSGHI